MASTGPEGAHHPAHAVEERAGRASPGGSEEPPRARATPETSALPTRST